MGGDAGLHHLRRRLHFSGVFAPGNIDHHNVQLTLCLAAITALIVGRSYAAGIAAGAACALMLAVGMETLPYVAVAGLTASAAYLLGDRAEAAEEAAKDAAKAAGFGLGLAGVGLAAFVATVPTSNWLSPLLRRLLNPAIRGCGDLRTRLGSDSSFPALGRALGRRLGALLALGIAVAVIAVTAFPQCLADPYAGLDPRLQQFWLNQVTEAQSFRACYPRIGSRPQAITSRPSSRWPCSACACADVATRRDGY